MQMTKTIESLRMIESSARPMSRSCAAFARRRSHRLLDREQATDE